MTRPPAWIVPVHSAYRRLAAPLGPATRLHAGLLIALAAVVLVAWLLDKTTLGFEIRTVGINPSAAQYAGMHVARTLVCTMALSGMLAGLAGAVEILGLYHTLPATFSTGYGFDAIAIALLAKSRPLGVLPAALLWGGLRNGAGLMQVRTGVSIDLINVIQALVIMGLVADHLVRTLRRRRVGVAGRTRAAAPPGTRPALSPRRYGTRGGPTR